MDAPLSNIHDEDTYEAIREALNTSHVMGVCVVTNLPDCRERECELHYMSAPLTLAFVPTGICPVCQREADHEPFDANMACVDVFGPGWSV